MSKIVICGLNGSGKTTLGKLLAAKTNYLHKDIEEYYFDDDSNYKYNKAKSKDKQTVIKLIEEDFEKYNNIIFTACKGDYGIINEKYDLAIYLKVPKEERIKRVKERSYKQFQDRILPDGDLYNQEQEFWTYVINRDETEVTEWFDKLPCKKIILDGTKTPEENATIIAKLLKC